MTKMPTMRILRAASFRTASFARRSIGTAILFAAILIPQVNGANELTLNVEAGSATARPGDLISITLDVAGLTSPINGIQAFLHYDPSVLRLVDSVGTVDAGGEWTSITEDRGGGDFLQLLVMLGSDILIDHATATLTFEAIAVGTTRVTFLEDALPLQTKLTASAGAAAIPPNKSNSGEIMVFGTDVPTISDWGLVTMALALTTMATLVLRRNSVVRER